MLYFWSEGVQPEAPCEILETTQLMEIMIGDNAHGRREVQTANLPPDGHPVTGMGFAYM